MNWTILGQRVHIYLADSDTAAARTIYQEAMERRLDRGRARRRRAQTASASAASIGRR
jgi:hypothetical protein